MRFSLTSSGQESYKSTRLRKAMEPSFLDARHGKEGFFLPNFLKIKRHSGENYGYVTGNQQNHWIKW
jgi:hypothetical protein